VIGAPSINVYPPAEPASFDRDIGGGCVIHKLIYAATANTSASSKLRSADARMGLASGGSAASGDAGR